MTERIENVSIVVETERRYLNYAQSVIMSRALPDVRDGLKPVQRRILYNMFHDLHLYHDERPIKCAKVVGEVLGKYHPHGDMSVYDALVRMAQPFTLRYPLIHGEGNFGSVDGNEAAAYRYTECKLTAIAEELMTELRQRTVDMRPTFDAVDEEPVVLPARFPNLLVNGTSGIAVGMATNIPPHNLREVIEAAIYLIENPDATVKELLKFIKGPDFPLGGKVLASRKTLQQIYEQGQGTIKVQAEWKLEKVGRRQQIVITSIPYGVNKAALEEHIGRLIAERKIPQLLNIVNESSAKEGIRVVLELRSDADPEMVMAYLYKHTALQENFSYNMTCLVPVRLTQHNTTDQTITALRPKRLGLVEILSEFLKFRFETVRRRFQFQLEQLRQRIHILEGFRKIFQDLDRVIRTIRSSQNREEAATKLMRQFGLDQVQVNAILELLLYKLARLEIQRILDELQEKRAEAQRLEGILRSERKLWEVVRTELEEIAQKYGDKRRTKIVDEQELPDYDPEAFIVRENTHVIVTRDGWVKRVTRLTSLENTRIREGDEILAVVPGSTLDRVVFFSDDGVAYTLPIHEIPASSGYGEPISKFVKLGEGARIIAALPTDSRFIPPPAPPTNSEPPGPYLVIVTAQGQVLRLPYGLYLEESTSRGRIYVRLNEGDRAIYVGLVREEQSLMLVASDGHVLHFPIEQIPILSGPGKGVIGIRLEEGARCLAAMLIKGPEDQLRVVTSSGREIILDGSRELSCRAGKGTEVIKRGEIVRVILPPPQLVNWEALDNSQRSETPPQADLFSSENKTEE
ncbi:MAG: DNA topoisomerase IV subunit A [Gemmatales bacterium]|nr:DNA topoisomerase IV subunit A [Gemmatales bacterium]MDW7995922.1 DNA topoisomerase IV subunit A [Gemmatales bacterium]